MSKEVRGSGVGIGGLLMVLFVGLKLANVIEWSWLWVFSPIWIPLVLMGLMFAVVGIVAMIISD